MKNLILALLTLSFASQASEVYVDVYGRSFTNSCGYYSNSVGQYQARLVHYRLPWGTKVFLRYGWQENLANGGGSDTVNAWVDQTEVEMKASAPYTWTVQVDKELHARSYNRRLTALQFVFRLAIPGQGDQYVKPPQSDYGYYQVSTHVYGNPCTAPGVELPKFQALDVKAIR